MEKIHSTPPADEGTSVDVGEFQNNINVLRNTINTIGIHNGIDIRPEMAPAATQAGTEEILRMTFASEEMIQAHPELRELARFAQSAIARHMPELNVLTPLNSVLFFHSGPVEETGAAAIMETGTMTILADGELLVNNYAKYTELFKGLLEEKTVGLVKQILAVGLVHEYMHFASTKIFFNDRTKDSETQTGFEHITDIEGPRPLMGFNEIITNYLAYKCVLDPGNDEIDTTDFRDLMKNSPWLEIVDLLDAKIGEEMIKKAYLYGDIDLLRNHINSFQDSSQPQDKWQQLIDASGGEDIDFEQESGREKSRLRFIELLKAL